MIYNQLELLEFFENEPITIEPTEACMFIYKRTIDLFKLNLYFSAYEDEGSFSIEINNISIINAELKSIKSICKNENCLIIDTKMEIIKIFYFDKYFSTFIEQKSK